MILQLIENSCGAMVCLIKMTILLSWMTMSPAIRVSCPVGGQVSDWNEDISTLPGQISSCLFSSEDEVNQSSRHDKERGVFTVGSFSGNIPFSLAWQSRSERTMDGFLYGVVDQHGQFTGHDIAFIYPDFLTGLRGSFVDGVLQNVAAVNVVAERCNNGVKELKFEHSAYEKGTIWEKEETNVTYIGKNRQVMDPYERKSVYVKESSNPSAKEGLFAKRKFVQGDIVSYYGGLKLFVKDKNFDNMTSGEITEACACHLSLGIYAPASWGFPRKLLLDVPEKYRSLVEYRTTLGHKANHSFKNNAEYTAVDHPVLGGIACLVATTEIDVDEEVFAHYRYGNIDRVPVQWYVDEYNNVYGENGEICFARKKFC